MNKKRIKKKSNFQIRSKEIMNKVLSCEGCEFEFQEAFEHAKDNPEDKVYLSVGWDDEGQPHVGIKVYDKKGRKIIW